MDADLRARAKAHAAQDPFPMLGFSHVDWWVGNAYQTAMFFRSILGFSIVGYRGPETGHRETSSYLLESGNIRFIVTGAKGPIIRSRITFISTDRECTTSPSGSPAPKRLFEREQEKRGNL